MEFTFENAGTLTTGTKTIAGTAELQAYCNAEATAIIKDICARPDLAEAANAMTDAGEYASTSAFIKEHWVLDGTCIADVEDESLARMLESRRSERSRAKKDGIRSSVAVLQRYLSATIAEMLIRERLGKTYKPTNSGEFSVEELARDQEALGRKVRSLQSRASNLRRQGQFAPADWEGWDALRDVEERIAELNAHRVGLKVKTAKASVSINDIKTALGGMTEEDKKALLAMLKANKNA